jgi:hypothetical protein
MCQQEFFNTNTKAYACNGFAYSIRLPRHQYERKTGCKDMCELASKRPSWHHKCLGISNNGRSSAERARSVIEASHNRVDVAHSTSGDVLALYNSIYEEEILLHLHQEIYCTRPSARTWCNVARHRSYGHLKETCCLHLQVWRVSHVENMGTDVWRLSCRTHCDKPHIMHKETSACSDPTDLHHPVSSKTSSEPSM